MTDSIALFSESVSRTLTHFSPVEPMRSAQCLPESLARNLWSRAVSLGWTGLYADSKYGGVGLGAEYLYALGRQLGASLAAGPFDANLALVPALGNLPMAQDFRDAVVTDIVDGKIVATVMRWDRERVGAWVDHASVANHMIDVRCTQDGPVTTLRVRLIAMDDPGVKSAPLSLFDPTSPGLMIGLDETRVNPRAEFQVSEPTEIIDRAFTPARIFGAAQAVGLSQRAMDLAIEHVCGRHQFGRPIGSFQAIKHKLADSYVDTQKARVLAEHAARDFETGGYNAILDSHAAWVAATHAAVEASQHCIQLHGALGYSWEHTSHLLLRRARSLATLCVGVLPSVEVISGTISKPGILRDYEAVDHSPAISEPAR